MGNKKRNMLVNLQSVRSEGTNPREIGYVNTTDNDYQKKKNNKPQKPTHVK